MSGRCANVKPPACLISRIPADPSASPPESTTPIAQSAYVTASDVKRTSTGEGRSVGTPPFQVDVTVTHGEDGVRRE